MSGVILTRLKFVAFVFYLFTVAACSRDSSNNSAVAGKPLNISIGTQCENSDKINQLQVPGLENIDQKSAIKRANQYLNYVKCENKFPENSSFKAYFFSPDMLSDTYKVIFHEEGFNKVPGSLLVQGDEGLTLLFCFNKMVINCAEVAACSCPYDFNHEPKKKPR